MNVDEAASVDPFVFVAATRYAIRRVMTSASQRVARQVAEHAVLIASHRGSAAAIAREVEEFVQNYDAQEGGVTAGELRAAKEIWRRAADAIEDERGRVAER